MRKYLVLLLSLTVTSTSVYALAQNEQLNAVRNMFMKEFNQIDTDKNGQISQEEYLAYQFKNLRSSVLSSSGFAAESKEETPAVKESEKTTEKTTDIEMGEIPEALKAMAEFDLDMDDANALTDISAKAEEADVEIEEVEDALKAHAVDLDLSMSEDENLQNLLKEMDTGTAALATDNQLEDLEADNAELSTDTKEKNKQIKMMMDTIRKTLPKKIDAITTWTDIKYKNSTISYIYKADMDTSKFTDAEKKSLELSIKNEACLKAYTDMCPKVKPMFIDEGINVQIQYFDNNNNELSSCEFNKETCSD